MTSQLTYETPAELRRRLAKRWKIIEGQLLSLSLSFPYEVQIKGPKLNNHNFLSERASHRAWIGLWRSEQVNGHPLTISTRNFRTFKDVQFPRSLLFEDQDDLLSFMGTSYRTSLERLRTRLVALGYTSDDLTDKNPRHASVRDRISALSDEEFAVLLRLKDWRRANQDKTPALRELQIEGLDTKWVEKNASIVLSVLEDFNLMLFTEGSFYARAGFREDERRTLWFKQHAPVVLLGQPRYEFAIRPEPCTAVPEGVESALMVENITTFNSLKPSKGTVVLFGSGKLAANLVQDLLWLKDIPFFYWGDMDSSGYLILDRIRKHIPNVQSLFMSTDDMAENMSFAVVDNAMETSIVSRLTSEEASARDYLFERRLRIEQERISDPWRRLCNENLT